MHYEFKLVSGLRPDARSCRIEGVAVADIHGPIGTSFTLSPRCGRRQWSPFLILVGNQIAESARMMSSYPCGTCAYILSSSAYRVAISQDVQCGLAILPLVEARLLCDCSLSRNPCQLARTGKRSRP